MLTKLAQKYGAGLTDMAYLELAAKETNCSPNVVMKAKEIYGLQPHLSGNSEGSMDIMAILYQATLLTGERKPIKIWKEICSYNTLLYRARMRQYRNYIPQ